MPTDTEILRQMINTNATVQPQQQNNRNFVELCEPQTNNSRVKIYGLPDDTVVIKADTFPSPDTIFQGNKGECNGCSFLC
jgi:hypothetical protein